MQREIGAAAAPGHVCAPFMAVFSRAWRLVS